MHAELMMVIMDETAGAQTLTEAAGSISGALSRKQPAPVISQELVTFLTLIAVKEI